MTYSSALINVYSLLLAILSSRMNASFYLNTVHFLAAKNCLLLPDVIFYHHNTRTYLQCNKIILIQAIKHCYYYYLLLQLSRLDIPYKIQSNVDQRRPLQSSWHYHISPWVSQFTYLTCVTFLFTWGSSGPNYRQFPVLTPSPTRNFLNVGQR